MRLALAALALAASTLVLGQAAEVAHPDARAEARLKALADELRCLVCQNQTIADSDAPLALDLRNQIRGQIAQGRSDEQIRGYLVDRYGDFILYRPPFKASTAALWIAPFALVVVGAIAFAAIVRRRRSPGEAGAPETRRAEIEALLDPDAGLSAPPPPTPRRAR